jgi:protein-S-isoprenylcysteine O-methyltransferase Ste14
MTPWKALRIAADLAFLISWAAFLIAILIGSLPAIKRWGEVALKPERSAADPRNAIGLALQAIGLVFLTLIAPRSALRASPLVSVAVLMLAPVSAAVFFWALRLSPGAGESNLVTKGPYAVVRHPLYMSLGGMLCATALLAATPLGAAVGLGLYIAGCEWKTSAEEDALTRRFQMAYVTYQQSVRWRYLPGIR